MSTQLPSSLEEINKADTDAGVIVNGVDSPNILSVDSTEPLPLKADEIVLSEDEKKALPDEVNPKEEKKESTEKDPPSEEKAAKEEEKPAPAPEEKKSGDSEKVVKRIGKLTKKMRTAEREAEYQKTKRLEAEARLKELESKIPADDKPLKDDFDDEDDYLEALTDWKIDNRLKASQESVTEEIEDKEERAAVQETYNGLDDALERGAKLHEDFSDVVLNEDLVISPELTQILLDTDIPEDILYHLGSNPDESARISELSPVGIAREVGKLEAKLVKAEAEPAETKSEPKPRKTQSKAPAPIEPVATTGVVGKDPDKMSPAEYRKWREENP